MGRHKQPLRESKSVISIVDGGPIYITGFDIGK